MRYLILILLFLPIYLHSQCPPPGFPEPGDNCGAPLICENLDGYCNTINNNNVSRPFPCCAGWTLNNDEWFGFFAGTTTISIQITPSNCSPGGQQGLQGGIYAACPPGNPGNNWCNNNVMDTQCSCTEDPFTLTSTDFVVGEVYWIVLDGCAGNLCDYTINVIEGSTISFGPDDPGPVSGSSPVCQGSTSVYQVAPVNGATQYDWTISPANAGTITGSANQATVTWAAGFSGTASLCVEVSNSCYTNTNESCLDIEVIPLPTAQLSGDGSICVSSGGSVDLTITLTGDPDWEIVYALNGVPRPPVIANASPYTLTVNQLGTYTLVSVKSIDTNPACSGTVSGSAVVSGVSLTTSATLTSATCGQPNGAVDFSVSGGNSPYSYNWSNGETAQDLSGVVPGTYTVTVTENSGCSATLSATVNDIITNPTLSAVIGANTSCDTPNGTINLTASPAGSYNYQWSNGAATEDLDGLSGGVYTVTVTLGSTCSSTGSYNVADVPNLPVATGIVTNTTCDLANGSIQVTITGGVGPFTYLWDNGATTEDLSNILAGDYELTVTGANGCTSTLSATVGNTNPVISLSGTSSPQTNCDDPDGNVLLSVNPPGNYSFLWSDGSTGQNLLGVAAGNYEVTVSSGGSCTQVGSYSVAYSPNLPVLSATTISSTCDQPNGSIQVTITGGVGPFTYLWDNGATTEDLSNILAGDYELTVTGANGCTSTLSATVGNTNPVISLSGTSSPQTNCDDPDGNVLLSVNPPGNYSFLWSDGSTGQNLLGVAAGSYEVTVSSGGSCTQVGSYSVAYSPNLPVLSATTISSTCDQPNGSIQVTITGGVGPFTYLWDNGATTEDLSNIVAGDYELTVTGANGCTATLSATVGNTNPVISLSGTSSPQTNCDDPDGNVLLSVNPPGNYSFFWSDGSTGQNLLSVAAGNYEVTVSSGGSCTQVGSYSVAYSPNLPLLSATTVSSTCDQPNGSVNLTVVGGAAPYSYAWSNGASTQDLNGLLAGLYEVIVTGANGCSASLEVTVDNIGADINLFADVAENTLCSGGNGSINLIVTPADNYDYLWSNGAITEDIDNLTSGAYTVTVTLGNSCTEEGTFVVMNSANLPNISAVGQPDTCSAGVGSIQTTITGGLQPFSYIWSNGATTAHLGQLFAGPYSVTATDANQCQTSISLNLTNIDLPFSIAASVLPNTTCIGGNGSIAVVVTPAGSYDFEWSNGATTSTISQLWSGTYQVTISQQNGCVLDTSFVVGSQPNNPVVLAQTQPSVCLSSNGSIDVTLTGGDAPFQFQWSNGATTEDISGLQAGVYTVTVTGANSCVAVSNVEVLVSNNNLQGAVDTLIHPACFGASSGSASVSATGGNGSYSFLWSTGDTSAMVSNLLAGSYTVIISDADQCQDTLLLGLTQPDTLQANASATPETELNGNDGTATANPTGGTAPFQYLWSNGGTSQSITGLSPGEYTVSITDANGCTAQATVYVSAYECALMPTFTTTHVRCFGEGNGAIQVSMSGGTAPYKYQWSNGATTASLNNLTPGVYGLIASDAGDCFGFFFVEIQQPAILTAEIVQIQHVVCAEDSTGAVELDIIGGTPPYNVQWPYGNGQQLVVGQYVVPVSDINGCADTVAFAIVANDTIAPVLDCPEDKIVCGAGVVNYPAPVGADNCEGLQTPLQTGGLPSGSFFEIGVTVNTFAVSDAMGNTSSCSFSVTVVDAPLILINSIMHDVNSQGVGAILITVIGSGGYTFAWTKNGQPYSNEEDLTGLSAGVYGLVLSDSNGCTASIPPILISNFVGQENPGLAPVIRLMPNPATDLLYLEVSNTQLESVSICDMRGAVLRDMHTEEWSRGIFVGQLPAGMYVLRARLSDGRLWVEKWMKK